jgi:hypothetical protein
MYLTTSLMTMRSMRSSALTKGIMSVKQKGGLKAI